MWEGKSKKISSLPPCGKGREVGSHLLPTSQRSPCELFEFYDQLSNVEEFESVNKEDFCERHDKFRNSRIKKKKENKLTFQKKFHLMKILFLKRAFFV